MSTSHGRRKMMWKNKRVLITGGNGMIGMELARLLIDLEAKVYVVDMDPCLKTEGCVGYFNYDLRKYTYCLSAVKDMDYVFHLAGVKGNPRMTKERPVDFMGPMLQFDTNMILASQKQGVKKFLYTSSIAVENPETDKYPAWAKQTAETLIEAMRIQYPKGTEYCIVRPANVYGRFDNFQNPDAMVITSLIAKAISESRMLKVWGDGTQVRDFINAKDVARGMIQAMETGGTGPHNLCSGQSVEIGQVADIIAQATGKKLEFDTSKPTGDQRRVMNINWDFKPEIGIEEGIKEVIKHVQRSNSNREV